MLKKIVRNPVLSIIALTVFAVGGVGITSSALAGKFVPVTDNEEKEANEVEFDGKIKEEGSGGSSGELISVKPSDENMFRPEEWKRILSQIEKGVISWEDEKGNIIPNDVGDREAIYNSKDQKVEEK